VKRGCSKPFAEAPFGCENLVAMQWWRRVRDRLQWFDHAGWPGGVSWPQGAPSERPDYRRKITTTAVVPIAAGGILIATGLPFGVALALFALVIAAVVGYVIRESIREAKRQGWGSNLR
jgi:hypothetical protein